MTGQGSRVGRLALRFLVSGGLLLALTRVIDIDAVVGRLTTLSPAWVCAALLLSVGQALLLAWRWRVTARRLDLELSFSVALSEYYLGNFLNQVLPGGVVGDASRAWRHARHESAPRPAVSAVVLERGSAQVIMTATACFSIALLPLPTPLRAAGALAALGVLAGAFAFVTRTRSSGPVGRLAEDARRAVTAEGVVTFHFVTGLLAVGSYIVTYLIAAQALGGASHPGTLAPLVAPVLMTMLLPVSIAGWGVREVAAAALWGAVGLTPEDGVAISVAYGAIVLLSTLPGAVVLIAPVARTRDRRARPLRSETSGTADEARRSDSESDRA